MQPVFASWGMAEWSMALKRRLQYLYSSNLGEMAEWSIAAVLKTVEVRASGGSNPSLSAESLRQKVTEDRQTVQIERFERFFYVVMADKKDRK